MPLRVLSAMALYAAFTASAQAADTASAESFLRQLYAGYAIESGPNTPQPLGKQADGIFDKDLLGLIRRDQSTAADAGGGLMRVDPICDCQDWDGLQVQKVTVQPKGATQAAATVSFVNAGHNHTLSYQLVDENGQWRVNDIQSGNQPGLRHYLEAGLAQRAAESKASPPSGTPTAQTAASAQAGSEASAASPPPPSPQDTTYLYAVTVHDDGSVSLKQAQTFSTQLVNRSRCSMMGMRQQPNARPEWHLQQLGGWFNGACQMIGTAEFETLDAFRAYLKQTGVGTALDDGCGLTLHITLPLQPPNPATYVTVRLKLPGAEPVTKGAWRGTSDKDELTWTFTRQAQQSLTVEAAATSETSDSNATSALSSQFALTKATTHDAQTISVWYRVGGGSLTKPVTLEVYRSSESHVNDTSDLIGEAQLAEADTQPGEHNDIKLTPSFDLSPNTAKPFMIVQLKGAGPKCSTYFRKYMLGAVSHGLEASYLKSFPPDPDWENSMRDALLQYDKFDECVISNWRYESKQEEQRETIYAGNTMYSKMESYARTISSGHPGDVVDIHLFGHSRGGPVTSQILLDMTNRSLTSMSGSYVSVTLLDPHPANNSFGLAASIDSGNIGLAAEAVYLSFQSKTIDPPVIFPAGAGIRRIDVWYQHTNHEEFSGLSKEYYMNLWGHGQGDPAIVNNSGTTISWHNMTGGIDDANHIAKIGHSEIIDYYIANIAKSGNIDRSE